MNPVHLRNGWRIGVTFGIVTIFLVLIGFHVTISTSIGNLLHTNALPFSDSLNLAIFFFLLGLWAGSSASRAAISDIQSNVLAIGALAGAVCGSMLSVLALIIGILNDSGVKMRVYLAALSPENVQAFLFGLPPVVGAILYVVFLTAAGIAGGALSRSVQRGEWRTRLSAWWKKRRQAFEAIPLVERSRREPHIRYSTYGILALVLLAIPLTLGQYWNYNLGTIGIYVLLGLGLNIVVGLAGMLDLGYVAFFAIGAYTMALLTGPEPHHLLWSFWAAMPFSILLAALAGILLGIPVLRMRGDYLAIVTLGFGEIIRILSKSDRLTNFTGGPRGVGKIAGPTLLGYDINSEIHFVYLIILAVLLGIYITIRLQNSRIGRAWVAMREDETVAQAMGINTWRMKLLAFGIGAAFAGLGGALFASRNQFTGPEDHILMVSINVLALVIVGGMGSIPGVIAGALALKGLPEILRELKNYRVLVFGALLVAMMIWRPEGIFPSTRRRLEMHQSDEGEITEVTLPPTAEEG